MTNFTSTQSAALRVKEAGTCNFFATEEVMGAKISIVYIWKTIFRQKLFPTG